MSKPWKNESEDEGTPKPDSKKYSPLPSSSLKNENNNYSKSSNDKCNNNFNRKFNSISRSKSPKRSLPRKPNDRNNNRNPEPCECIGVFGLSQSTTKDKLYDIFGKFGEIISLNLIIDKNTNVSLGFGFIKYETVEIATKAKEECNEMDIDGKSIRVDYSITKKAHTPTPGVYKGKSSNRRNVNFNDHRRDDREGKHVDRNNRFGDRDTRRERRDDNYSRDHYRNDKFCEDSRRANNRFDEDRNYRFRSIERNMPNKRTYNDNRRGNNDDYHGREIIHDPRRTYDRDEPRMYKKAVRRESPSSRYGQYDERNSDRRRSPLNKHEYRNADNYSIERRSRSTSPREKRFRRY